RLGGGARQLVGVEVAGEGDEGAHRREAEQGGEEGDEVGREARTTAGAREGVDVEGACAVRVAEGDAIQLRVEGAARRAGFPVGELVERGGTHRAGGDGRAGHDGPGGRRGHVGVRPGARRRGFGSVTAPRGGGAREQAI